MPETTLNNKRIVKNTIYLYFRTFIIMLITLYTSRVILNALGVQDYGVFNAVGGVVSMFGFITAALSASISRYITFELGKNGDDIERLRVIFSTSIRIQVVLGLIVLAIGEVLGVWFLNSRMNIPIDRIIAANWVFQCSLISFIISLISVPYNASIIAHEHMNAYALVSILDALLRLSICFFLVISPWDKLATYSVLIVVVAILIRFTYGIYCNRKFKECKYICVRDKNLARRMFGFASYSFLNNAVNIFNHQGISLLVNLFFGVLFNAARGIAIQVESAIMNLVNNLTLAVRPQITKSYAMGDKERMFNLICSGSKYSFFLFLLFAIPVFIETNFVLKLWLKVVPDYSVLFLRLTLIGALLKMLGNTGYTACMATGKIKKYSIWITSVGILAFPLTYIFYKLDYPVEYAYYSYILTYILIEVVRLYLMKGLIDFPPFRFVKDVIFYVSLITPLSLMLPYYIYISLDSGIVRFLTVILVSTLWTLLIIYFFGLKKVERHQVKKMIKSKIHRK